MRSILIIMTGIFCLMQELNAQVDKNDSTEHYIPTARYHRDISELARTLEKKYDEKKHRPAGDSTLLIKAYVGQQLLNDLELITLIKGTKSAFSDFIMQGLRESGRSWRPMLQGGRAVKSYLSVYARLNKDSSITISTSIFRETY